MNESRTTNDGISEGHMTQTIDTVSPVKQKIDIVTELPGPKSAALQLLSEGYEPETFAHGQVPFGFKRGSGVFVEDVDGNTFLDFTSGVLVANIGHSRTRVMKRIEKMAQNGEITNIYNFLNPYRPALARLLMETVPDYCTDLRVGKAFILTTGSETIEWAMGMAIKHQGAVGNPEKKKIVAFDGAFHGRTAGARHAGGIGEVTAGYGLDIPDFVHIPFPDLYRPSKHPDSRPYTLRDYIDAIERIDHAPVAAVLFETYQGTAGSRIFPAEYLNALAAWVKRHDILLLVDEVQASFGRTGKFYGFEHYGLEPDILCLGKGISGSVPLAAIIARRDIVASQGGMSSTWGGNILSSAVALETIKILIEEGVVENAANVGNFMIRRFHDMVERHPTMGDSRQMGLVGALDIVTDKASKTPNPRAAEEVVKGCYQKGLLLIEPIGLGRNVIRIAPPLIITEEQADQGMDIIDGVLSKVEGG